MKKKIGIILSVVFIALLISTISVYAYIRSSIGKRISITIRISAGITGGTRR